MFLEAVGINNPEHKEDFTISDSYIDQAMGKEIMILSYPSVKKNPKTGKSYWNDWDNVGSVYKGMDNLNVVDELLTLLLNLAGKKQWLQ